MMMSSYLLFFSTDFVGCNLIRSLFYFAWREKEKSSKKKKTHQIKQLLTAGDVEMTLT